MKMHKCNHPESKHEICMSDTWALAYQMDIADCSDCPGKGDLVEVKVISTPCNVEDFEL